MESTDQLNNKKKVIVFGVFDLLHPGHLYFLQHAKSYGTYLCAIVTRDNIVRQLKHQFPFQLQLQRLAQVNNICEVNDAILGDEHLGDYAVLKQYQPDIIVVGYDQHFLKMDLEERMQRQELPLCPIVQVGSYYPEVYSTTILKKLLV